MDEADMHSPREDFTSDDYTSSSDESSRPSTSEVTPDRNQQPARVSSIAFASDPPSTPRGQARPSVPKLGFKFPGKPPHEREQSRLQLSKPGVVEQTAAQSRQEPAVPQLQLQGPAGQNVESTSDRAASGRSFSGAHSQRKSFRQSPKPLFTIHLASDALSMTADTLQRSEFVHMSHTEAVKQFCATELGIRQGALRLFQLQEVTELSDTPAQLAIAVEDSGFALAAYEEMVQENKQVKFANQQCTISINELRRLVEEGTAEMSRNKYTIAELEADKKRLHEQNSKLQQEAVMMRDSLHRANQAQRDGQDQLRQLKAEFDDMNASFMQTCLGSTSGTEGGQSASLIRGPSGSQLAISTQPAPVALLDDRHQRLVTALDRLSDKSCLDSLELLPQLLEWLPKLSDQLLQSHTSPRHLKIGIASQKSQNEHWD